MQTVPIALLGCGTVGSGAVRLLTEDADFLAQRTGLRFEVRYVLAKAANPKARKVLAHAKWVESMDPILADPQIGIVVELIGGETFALECVRQALTAGKAVVTANKAMLARHGGELFPLAHEKKSCIAFEASCAGGVPVILGLRDGLVANRIRAIYGILNGTANYILTEMTAAGKPYSQALAEAQQAGYAEADPTYDVEGIDAAHKIAILASMAFGEDIPFDRISIEGISKLELVDIVNAGQLGYVVKLLAIAERMTDHRLSLRVHPTLVGRGTPLAMVDGPFNAISIFGHAVGHVLMYGRGAGQSPTASAVVSDLVDIAIGHAHRRFQSLHIWPGKTRPAQIVSTDRLSSRFYLRLSVADQPGVFAQITKVFGGHNISLASVLQKESSISPGKAGVNVLMMTHRAVEGDLRAALTQINRLDVVKSPTIWLRVVDMPADGIDACDEWNRKE